jgi:hypothetical protein
MKATWEHEDGPEQVGVGVGHLGHAVVLPSLQNVIWRMCMGERG